MGVYCHHDYAHAGIGAKERIPATMKGIDAAVWNVCQALGLAIRSLPVYEPDDGYDYSGSESDYGGDSPTEKMRWDPFSLFGLTAASETQLSGNDPEYIGSKFKPVEHISNRDRDLKRCQGIHWLNAPKHRAINATYYTVRNPVMLCSMIVWKFPGKGLVLFRCSLVYLGS